MQVKTAIIKSLQKKEFCSIKKQSKLSNKEHYRILPPCFEKKYVNRFEIYREIDLRILKRKKERRDDVFSTDVEYLQNLPTFWKNQNFDVKNFLKENEKMELLNKLHSLQYRKKMQEAVNLIFERLDEKFVNAKLDWCDDLFLQIDISKFDLPILFGFLSASFMWRAKLHNRKEFFFQVREKAIKTDALFKSKYKGLLDGLA
jgi:hypothetical protein